ncbi:D-galactarate permease [Klebsiella grimontii]|uniref:D-galactarate permease n=1 Tax=Klebsiella grimontii TaxID=2058152 RepID=A0A7H4NW60_9ENTR|nr:D-galactarate permease [Klebsiella grimontii]
MPTGRRCRFAGTEVAKELQLSAVSMGYIFSAFGWAYLLMQIPGGWLLDKFGSKKVYSYSLFFWSLFTFLQGFVDMFPLAWAGISMFFMRFMLGFSEAPSFPANARIVAAWFPTKERGTASAIFNSAQYFSLALFSPLLGWLTFAWGWEHVFTVMGVIGFVLTGLWIKLIHNPTDHPRMTQEELKFISENGAVVDMDHKKPGSVAASGPKLHYIKQLLTNRMMLGVFLRSIFYQYHYLVLPHLVPDLSGAGKGYVDSESGSGRIDSGAVRFCRRRAGRRVL